jgi:hypothetical protein
VARIRSNNVFGSTTDDPLTNVATTLNSAGLANLAAVTGADHALITLDPGRVAGAPEIVRVTAHTASATSATITRGQFGTAAREHLVGTAWEHAPVAHTDQTAQVTDFPGEWEDYTPSNTNVTVGNGTETARFCRIGNTVFWRYSLRWGSTTSYGGDIQIGLPVTMANPASDPQSPAGAGSVTESGVASQPVTATASASDDDSVRLVHHELTSNGFVDATAPFTWGTADKIDVGGSYEAA